MIPVTKWFRQKKDKHGNNVFEFNHLEDGHAIADKPVPKFESQNGWKGSTWTKEHRHMTEDHVIIPIYTGDFC